MVCVSRNMHAMVSKFCPRYTEAIQLFKSSQDVAWYAAALEGIATVSMIEAWSAGNGLVRLMYRVRAIKQLTLFRIIQQPLRQKNHGRMSLRNCLKQLLSTTNLLQLTESRIIHSYHICIPLVFFGILRFFLPSGLRKAGVPSLLQQCCNQLQLCTFLLPFSLTRMPEGLVLSGLVQSRESQGGQSRRFLHRCMVHGSYIWVRENESLSCKRWLGYMPASDTRGRKHTCCARCLVVFWT